MCDDLWMSAERPDLLADPAELAALAARWRDALESWAIPPEILAQAPALPWEGPGEGRVCARFLAIDVAATRRLKDEAAALGVTFAARVLAAWTHALGQWSGHEEVVVKVAEARRDAPLPGLEGVVGCFADTTPLRLPTRGGVEALSRALERLHPLPDPGD